MKLFRRKLEHEVRGETFCVAFDCLVEVFCLYAVEHSQIRVEQHFLTANPANGLRNALGRNNRFAH